MVVDAVPRNPSPTAKFSGNREKNRKSYVNPAPAARNTLKLQQILCGYPKTGTGNRNAGNREGFTERTRKGIRAWAEPVSVEGFPAKQEKFSFEGLISRHHTTEKHASPAAAPSRSSFSERSRRDRRAAPAGP